MGIHPLMDEINTFGKTAANVLPSQDPWGYAFSAQQQSTTCLDSKHAAPSNELLAVAGD